MRVTGEAARNFLQGLITNDIDQAKPGSAIHAGLLTPQGKILVDFFVLPAGDGFLLELAKAKLADLIQRLDDLQAPRPGRVRRGAVLTPLPRRGDATASCRTAPSPLPIRGCLSSGSASCFPPTAISAISAARRATRG